MSSYFDVRLLRGALITLAVVNVVQFGSIEVATGGLGITLAHAVSVDTGCPDSKVSPPSPLIVALERHYRGAIAESVEAAASPRRRQGSTVELVRSGGSKAMEALGGDSPSVAGAAGIRALDSPAYIRVDGHGRFRPHAD